MNNLYAFWKYDLFPYFLGGEIEKVEDSGEVKPLKYSGASFRPVFVTSFIHGEIIHTELNNLAHERAQELEKVYQKYSDKLNDLKNQYNIPV